MPELNVGGIVVCGGKSSRMGQPKLSLPFGDELMLPRVCRILAEVVHPIVVVGAAEQDVPPLPNGVRLLRDEFPGQGPLAGITTGLEALRDECLAVYVTSCDVPLLKPEFVRRLVARLGNYDAVVPVDAQYDHVLAAVYRTALAQKARELVESSRRRPLFLIQECRTLRIHVDELRDVDPKLDSLRNLNTPDDYASALNRAGLQAP